MHVVHLAGLVAAHAGEQHDAAGCLDVQEPREGPNQAVDGCLG